MHVDGPDRQGALLFMRCRWTELDPPVMQGDMCRARRAPGLGLLLAPFRASALALDLNAETATFRTGTQGVEELEAVSRVAVVLGPHQQVDTGVVALLIEQLIEVGLPIQHADQACLRQLFGHLAAVAQRLDPAIGLFLFDRYVAFWPGLLGRCRDRCPTLRAQHPQRQPIGGDRQGGMQMQPTGLGAGLVATDDAEVLTLRQGGVI